LFAENATDDDTEEGYGFEMEEGEEDLLAEAGTFETDEGKMSPFYSSRSAFSSNKIRSKDSFIN